MIGYNNFNHEVYAEHVLPFLECLDWVNARQCSKHWKLINDDKDLAVNIKNMFAACSNQAIIQNYMCQPGYRKAEARITQLASHLLISLYEMKPNGFEDYISYTLYRHRPIALNFFDVNFENIIVSNVAILGNYEDRCFAKSRHREDELLVFDLNGYTPNTPVKRFNVRLAQDDRRGSLIVCLPLSRDRFITVTNTGILVLWDITDLNQPSINVGHIDVFATAEDPERHSVEKAHLVVDDANPEMKFIRLGLHGRDRIALGGCIGVKLNSNDSFVIIEDRFRFIDEDDDSRHRLVREGIPVNELIQGGNCFDCDVQEEIVETDLSVIDVFASNNDNISDHRMARTVTKINKRITPPPPSYDLCGRPRTRKIMKLEGQSNQLQEVWRFGTLETSWFPSLLSNRFLISNQSKNDAKDLRKDLRLEMRDLKNRKICLSFTVENANKFWIFDEFLIVEQEKEKEKESESLIVFNIPIGIRIATISLNQFATIERGCSDTPNHRWQFAPTQRPTINVQDVTWIKEQKKLVVLLKKTRWSDDSTAEYFSEFVPIIFQARTPESEQEHVEFQRNPQPFPPQLPNQATLLNRLQCKIKEAERRNWIVVGPLVFSPIRAIVSLIQIVVGTIFGLVTAFVGYVGKVESARKFARNRKDDLLGGCKNLVFSLINIVSLGTSTHFLEPKIDAAFGI